MDIWKKLSQVCVFFLIVIAALVAVMIFLTGKAWEPIILYWIVLTVKNLFDYIETKKGDGGNYAQH